MCVRHLMSFTKFISIYFCCTVMVLAIMLQDLQGILITKFILYICKS